MTRVLARYSLVTLLIGLIEEEFEVALIGSGLGDEFHGKHVHHMLAAATSVEPRVGCGVGGQSNELHKYMEHHKHTQWNRTEWWAGDDYATLHDKPASPLTLYWEHPFFTIVVYCPALYCRCYPWTLATKQASFSSILKFAGGCPSQITSFPWQVVLHFIGFQICAGSIITEGHVLTAAHCVHNTNKSPTTPISKESLTVTYDFVHSLQLLRKNVICLCTST